jgi:hypothetical protein
VLRSIDRNEWARFFESFTLQHDHWLVRVDDETDTLPLEGVVARDGLITIHLGGDIRHHRVITVEAAAVNVLQDGGVDEGLAIEAKNGHITRLRFRSAIAPELVDGIA